MKKFLLCILSSLALGLTAQNTYTKAFNLADYKGANQTPAVSPAAGNNSTGLNVTYYAANVCGLNYVYGSVMTETRSIADGYNTNGTGFPATISISGIPTNCMQILQAYLYYDASYTENNAPTTTATIKNPAAVSATYASTLSGTGPQKCWGEKGTATYRTDVTAAISGNGTYTITLNGFANAGWEVDGCTLFIVYQAGPTTGTMGTLFLLDGTEVDNTYSLIEDVSDSVYGFDNCNASTVASSFFVFADQTDVPTASYGYQTNTETANAGHSALATTATFPNDQWNFNLIPTTLTSGQGATMFYPYRNNDPTQATSPPSSYDCYNWVMCGMYYQNTGCGSCLPVLTSAQMTLTYPACNGEDGTATAGTIVGTPPYTYTWSNGATTSSQSALSAGTYTITVEDVICNTTQTVFVITQPTALIGSKSGTGELCNNGNTGTATVTTSGGTAPYTYAWNPTGKTTASITGLSAGTYTVTVTDHKGCSETADVVVTQPALLNVSVGIPTNVPCNGGKGSATVTAGGGTAPYTYAWAPSGGSTATGTGLTAGTYTVTIHDVNGCSETQTVIITQPPLLTATMGVITNELCNGGNNGSATVSATGGTTPYTYAWSVSGGNAANGTGLTAGTYTVTVTDNNGCIATSTAIVTQPALLISSIGIPTNVLCNGGDNGSATASATGGTAPYTYAWAPTSGSTATGTGFAAGTYTVTVIDKNSCTASSTIIITQPTALGTSTSVTNALCNLPNGSASVAVTGGTPPYTYAWSTVPAQTAATATGLGAGVYTVVVTDKNSCTTTATVTVSESSAVVLTISGTQGDLCNGGNTGTTTVNATGGTPPYTYAWSTTPIQTTTTANGLSTGTYTIAVADNTGCISSATAVITQPALLTASVGVLTNVVCNGGNNGSAIATATGGTLPYTYSWSPAGGNAIAANGLTAGTYTVTITDNNECTSTATVAITQPSLVTATLSGTTNVSCNGGSNGSATVTTTGGIVPYTYSWSPLGGSSATGTGLTAGSYTVTVTDNNGCAASTVATITQPLGIGASTGFTAASCNLPNGSATVIATGGTVPYTYVWSTNPPQTTAIAVGVSAGTYSVLVIDNNNCTTTATVTITQPSAVNVTISGTTGVTCNGGNNGTASTTVTGGVAPYTYSWSPAGGNGATGTGLSAGTYTVTVNDNNGCASTAIAVVSQATLLTATISITTGVSCNGGSNGTATATATGGTGAYTYTWVPTGGNAATGTGFSAGTYTVTVTDNNGCIATISATITQPSAIVATISATTGVSCNGGNNGTAAVIVAGGTIPYTYMWSPGGNSNAEATGLSTGIYTVTVTDHNGCSSTVPATITEPPLLTATTVVTNILCNGQATGSITATATGGTIPYTYTWTPSGGNTATANGLTAGNYTVTVKDANGCDAVAKTTVTQPIALSATISGPNSLCFGSTAILTANAAGGTAPYTYSWNTGLTTNNISVSPAITTTYTVTVTDANGCKTSTMFTLSVGPALVVTTPVSLSTCGGKTVTICATASSGVPTFEWQPGNYTTPCITVTPTVTTTYTVSVVNGCGGIVKDSTLVVVNPLPNVVFDANLYQGCVPLCIQFNSSSSTISLGNIDSYVWKFGDGDSLSVSDAMHCYKDTGVFTVTLTETSNAGCSATLSKPHLIRVFPPPTAAFTYSPNPINSVNPTVDFANQSSGHYQIVQWNWTTFGDLSDSTSMLANPQHTYSDTGTFCPELIVTDLHGCSDTITSCLVVSPLYTFYIPNSFTPNGDGLDDIFSPKGTYIKDYEMYVFDRWGQQLYHTTDISNGWNGAVNGNTNVVQEGVYVYLIHVTDVQGNLHSYIGRITLLK